MSTKKFIISLACALLVLIVLSAFTIIFVGAKTHRTALLNSTWESIEFANEEETIVSSITTIVYNKDDTYTKTTQAMSEETDEIVETVEEGSFSIFNGTVKMNPTEGNAYSYTYEYDNEMHELDLCGFEKVQ